MQSSVSESREARGRPRTLGTFTRFERGHLTTTHKQASNELDEVSMIGEHFNLVSGIGLDGSVLQVS